MLERNYDALQFDGTYRPWRSLQLDGSYTLQIKNHGNFEGEGTNQPGVPSIAFDYPEIFDPDRHFPYGRLNDFQRHKIRLWESTTSISAASAPSTSAASGATTPG